MKYKILFDLVSTDKHINREFNLSLIEMDNSEISYIFDNYDEFNNVDELIIRDDGDDNKIEIMNSIYHIENKVIIYDKDFFIYKYTIIPIDEYYDRILSSSYNFNV